MAGSRVGSRHLQNVEKKIKFPRPVLSDQQEKMDRILNELESSSNRMGRFLDFLSYYVGI